MTRAIPVSKIKRRWLRRTAIVAIFPFAAVYSFMQAVALWLAMVALTLLVEPIRRLAQWVIVMCDTVESAQEFWK